MWKPGFSFAVTFSLTVSPGRASFGVTEVVSVTSFGLSAAGVSFVLGWASSACDRGDTGEAHQDRQ